MIIKINVKITKLRKTEKNADRVNEIHRNTMFTNVYRTSEVGTVQCAEVCKILDIEILQLSIYGQKSASIQPRTSPPKYYRRLRREVIFSSF